MARHFQSGPDKLKRSRTPRRWKANDQIFDLAVTFAIDEEIRKAQLQSRWQLTDAVLFGRRALAVAIEDANAYENYRPGEALAYWSATAKLAVRAHAALLDLIKHIGPAGVPSGDILIPMERIPSSLTKSQKITVKLLPRGQPLNQAKKDLEAILAARDACAGFASRSQQRWKGLASRRKNEGDLGKRSFVYRLAEGWIFLTGKRPGRSYSRNPFLRFVEAAWKDAGFHTETDFSRALNAGSVIPPLSVKGLFATCVRENAGTVAGTIPASKWRDADGYTPDLYRRPGVHCGVHRPDRAL